MIIGNGQLATAFNNIEHHSLCIFASGVSNSNCTAPEEFNRERKLLLDTLKQSHDIKIVYFSSCALSAPEYLKNNYYVHKNNMEVLIKEHTDNYYIFRLPQLFGELFLHNTLINYLYKCIEHNHRLKVFDSAYRYVIETGDVIKLVEAYLNYHNAGVTIDLANPYRYRVLDIVHIFEHLLNKRAKYELIEKDDQYFLDLSSMLSFVEQYNIDVKFGPDYLMRKLEKKIK